MVRVSLEKEKQTVSWSPHGEDSNEYASSLLFTLDNGVELSSPSEKSIGNRGGATKAAPARKWNAARGTYNELHPRPTPATAVQSCRSKLYDA